MKKIGLIFCVALISVSTFAQKKLITNQDIWTAPTFRANYVEGFNFLNDGKHYSRTEDGNIVKYDITTGETAGVIFKGENMGDAGKFSNYTFNDGESKIVFSTDVEKIYRYSSRANYYVWDTKNETLTPVADNAKQRNATLSPDGSKIAYVQNNDLYYKDLSSGKTTRITSDGKYNAIINGVTDWVYEEEFGIVRVFEWSPDSRRIAFLKSDESKVKEFTMPKYRGELYPEYVTFKYPKAGEDNAVVTLQMYDLKKGKTRKIDLNNKADMYIPRLKWTQDKNQLCVFQMNRHQNELDVFLVNAKRGKAKKILSEKNKYYVDIHDNLTFLDNGKEFIWTSEQDGYNHIYLYDMKGKMKKQITKGEYDVTDFYGVDEDDERVYYQAAEKSPMQREVYSINFKGKKKQKLSANEGSNRAQFSKTFDYLVNTHTAAGTPSSYTVHNADGELVRTIEDNKDLREKLNTYDISKPEFFDFKTSEGVKLNGWMIKPTDFDRAKKYPVLMYVYGGPNSQTVQDSWGGSNYFWHQSLVQQGYIIVSVDNRGTGARGEEFRKMTYQQLGKYETIDQIEAAKWLGKQPYVDAERIGIWGWSYGGYMSSLCLFKGADLFSTAIAVAPVTNWKWYDTIYTERFMRTPQENSDGYEDNSPINHVDKMKGKYLLVHGMGDDNVHAQNSFEMVNALIKANKHFDTYFYPNRNHSIYGGNTRLHLYDKMTDFISRNL